MITSADITIFNKRFDEKERTERFFPSHIKDVSFFKKKGAISGGQELNKSDAVTVRIPIDADMGGKTYIDAQAYEALSDDEIGRYWTLQVGALIVKGLVHGDDPVSEVELEQEGYDVIRIMNFTDNTDRATAVMKHWRVGGV